MNAITENTHYDHPWKPDVETSLTLVAAIVFAFLFWGLVTWAIVVWL